MVNRASMKTNNHESAPAKLRHERRPRWAERSGARLDEPTTTNREPTQMTPVTMCTTLRMTMDASAASIVPPLPGAGQSPTDRVLTRSRSRSDHEAAGVLSPRPLKNVADHAGARDGFWQVGVCIFPLALASLDDAEGEMRDPSAVDHPRALQVDGSGPQMVEQRDAAP